ncbi:hypothetical protein [Nonomuraea sp. NPDC050691]|uniref:hypothetical protein n=1 Tax=Nonomuraea sp. NPDC050691 TaxID=3155661 RepID=UPI0033FE06BB
MTDVVSRRCLNQATLAGQYLLERAPARAIDATEHLGGMQSQALTEQRQVVRLHLMRNTVHLVSATAWAGGQSDAPLLEQLAQGGGRTPLVGLDVDRTASVMGVRRGHVPALRVHPDTGRHGDRLPIDEDVEAGAGHGGDPPSGGLGAATVPATTERPGAAACASDTRP